MVEVHDSAQLKPEELVLLAEEQQLRHRSEYVGNERSRKVVKGDSLEVLASHGTLQEV